MGLATVIIKSIVISSLFMIAILIE